ncbi:MAG: DUF3226 domain-containing protein [Pseudomonadota bacterium]
MPTEIKERKIILAEGADAYYFSIWAYQAFGVRGVQVLNFGGIDDLLPYLSTLKELSGFKQVESMVIARDAEQDADAAVKSIKTSLKKAGLPVPDKAFVFSNTVPRVAYMIFPGFLKKGALADGSLEHLCLETINDDAIMNCVDQFIDCLKFQNKKPKYPQKTKLHTYLAGKDAFVGLKIGEAAKAGAWDWNHSKMKPFKKIIMKM